MTSLSWVGTEGKDGVLQCLSRLQQMHRQTCSCSHPQHSGYLTMTPTPPDSSFLELGLTQDLSSPHKVLLVLFLGSILLILNIYIGKLLTLLLLK